MANEENRPRLRQLGHLGLLAGCALVSLSVTSNLAHAADAWTVVEQSGTASLGLPDGRSLPLKAGDIVAEGDSVQTGPNGHLVLQHHDHADTMTVSPGSQFRIPDPHRESGLANVVESMGTVLFNVEHTPARRFEVDGPYLAAVVKGTSFTVEVAPGGNTVNVSQGAVEVQSRDTHQVALVHPGQFAMVSASGTHELSVGAKQTSIAPTPGAAGHPSSSSGIIGDTHLDVATLTNNLVTNAGAPGAAVAGTDNAHAVGHAGATPGNGAVTQPGLAGVTLGQPGNDDGNGNDNGKGKGKGKGKGIGQLLFGHGPKG